MALDVDEVEAMLLAAGRHGAAITYADALNALGHRFTRPLMRQLCVVLDEVDARGRALGRPGLAVLVVRQSDGLPGQGWWMGQQNYSGPWVGAQARAHVHALQLTVFLYCS